VTLTPKRPPGRLNRKALAFAADIQRLHWQGHSCEAIRQALADAGLTVSRSTVTREVARQAKRRTLGDSSGSSTAADAPMPPAREPDPATTPPLAADPRSGKEIAAAWVAGRNTNSFMRARTANEDSRH
jgi:histone H3/H4